MNSPLCRPVSNNQTKRCGVPSVSHMNTYNIFMHMYVRINTCITDPKPSNKPYELGNSWASVPFVQVYLSLYVNCFEVMF